MKPKKIRKTPRTVIASRRSCKPGGTGLSHYLPAARKPRP